MKGSLGSVHHEVVDELAVAVEGLCADSRRTRQYVAGPQFRDEAVQV